MDIGQITVLEKIITGTMVFVFVSIVGGRVLVNIIYRLFVKYFDKLEKMQEHNEKKMDMYEKQIHELEIRDGMVQEQINAIMVVCKERHRK